MTAVSLSAGRGCAVCGVGGERRHDASVARRGGTRIAGRGHQQGRPRLSAKRRRVGRGRREREVFMSGLCSGPQRRHLAESGRQRRSLLRPGLEEVSGGRSPIGREDGRCPRIRGAHGIRPSPMLTILFDGIAYGMLLFVLAVGLAVTMGLMNFINLAHGAFAMAGGYITVLLMQPAGVPFLVCLPLAFVGAALLGAVLERTLYRPLYAQAAPGPGAVLDRPGVHGGGGGRLLRRLDAADHPAARVAAGPHRRSSWRRHGPLPPVHHRRVRARSRWRCSGSCRARASAAGCARRSTTRAWPRAWASTSTWCSCSTFAFGSGLAGLGGALGAEVLGLDPTLPAQVHDLFPDRGGRRRHVTITGPLLAALLLGIADVAGKYYIPKMGAFIVYTLMIVILLLAAAGPVRAAAAARR